MPGIPSLATGQTALMVAWLLWVLYNYPENARAAIIDTSEAKAPAPGDFTQVTTTSDN